jgi:uncharacterized membrane protein YgdD (TMEM256/DUF423 family)
MFKPALVTGVVFAALAVILGAFGAHTLKDKFDAPTMAIFEKGVTYQFYHSFALLAVGMLHRSYQFPQLRIATVLFAFGILLFSGSLYVLSFLKSTGGSIGPAGVVTPIGGLCFIGGWIMLLTGILKK